ncbi:hypothetical protein BGZ59_011281 [Podila verticillata]|nr:hypothetical protein BGZ59_011281 [Podila verticillata]
MLKSATSFLALSLIALQVVVAQTIQNGIYLIEDIDSGKFLGIGPTPHVYPPIDTPVRLFEYRDPFVQHWRVKEAKDESAGQDEVQIKLPFNDRVFTSYPSSNPFDSKIVLQPAQGLPNQRYRFVRLDRNLYRSTRFNVQESC